MSLNKQRKLVAVVAGGGGGIGRACCVLFSQQGWDVVAADIDEAAAEQTAKLAGGSAVRLDLVSNKEIQAFASDIIAEKDGIDALVNAAAWYHPVKRAEVLSEEDWDQTFAVCLRGPYFLSAALGADMARRGTGAIVNLASTAGVRSAPLHAYAPAKAALINMTESLAAEFGRSGVRVNAVTPSLTRTPALEKALAAGDRFAPDVGRHTALRRMVEVDEVAEAVVFLASSEASAITGANLSVDAGSLLTDSWNMFGGLR